jgi:hypothetical protein
MMQKMDAGFSNLNGVEPTRNINTMPTGSAGSPPYQLDCGNKSATHAIATSKRSYNKPKRTISNKLNNRAQTRIKPINKNKALSKNITQAKSKPPAKSKNFHKAKTDIKSVSKAKNTYHH